MNKKNKKLVLILLIFATILIGIGFSYAFFTFRGVAANVELTMGDLSFRAELGTNSYTLGDLFPMSLEDDPYSTDNYVDFSLVSNNPVDTVYSTVKLIKGESYNDKIRIDDQFMHFSLKDLDNNTFVFEDKKCGLNGEIIYSTEITPSTSLIDKTVTRRYRLYAWVGDELIISDTDPNANYKSSDNGKSYLNKFSDLFCSFGFEIEGTTYELVPGHSQAILSNFVSYFGSSNKSSPKYSIVTTVSFLHYTDALMDEYNSSSSHSIVSSSSIPAPVYAYIKEDSEDNTKTNMIIFCENIIDMPINCNELFKGWSNLKNLDFSNADFSNVTCMSYFLFKTKVEEFVFPKIKSLNTVSYMFSGSGATEDNDYIKRVDFSNVEKFNNVSMFGVFVHCPNLEEIVFGHVNVVGSVNMNLFMDKSPKIKILDFSNWDLSGGVSLQAAFLNSNLEKIVFPDNTLITDISRAFSDSTKLKELDLSRVRYSGTSGFGSTFSNCNLLEELDLSNFRNKSTGTVTAASMFFGCTNLKTIKFGDFNMEKISSMNSMFYGCKNLVNIDLSNFDFSSINNTSNVNRMFYDCNSLEYLDLSSMNINPDQLVDFSSMFYNCYKLKSINFGNNKIKVNNMDSAFYKCFDLLRIPVEAFDTSKCTDFGNAFYHCESITELDLSGFDFSKATDISSMIASCSSLKKFIAHNMKLPATTINSNGNMAFNSCSNLEYIDLTGFESHSSNINNLHIPKNVKTLILKDALIYRTTMFNFYTTGDGVSSNSNSLIEYIDFSGTTFANLSSVFKINNLTHLKELNLSNATVSTATDMSYFLNGCTVLEKLNMSNFKAPLVTTLSNFFKGNTGIKEVNFSGAEFNSLTIMFNMMGSTIERVDMSNFKAPLVTALSSLFRECSNLTSVNLTGVNFNSVFTMDRLFNSSSLIEEIDMTWFKPNNTSTYDYSNMFNGCTGLRTIYASEDWNVSHISSDTNMFNGCTNLVGGSGVSYSSGNINSTYATTDKYLTFKR